tara:strand:- start:308 stop:529 length:222 start_codon:yes stop_codon:yes gene_type:complete
MNKTEKTILDMYKFQLIHYCKRGMGAQSELSTNTTITPLLVKTCLEAYIDRGGDENFSDITEARYREFLSEFK